VELRAKYSIFLPATKDSIHLLCIITIIITTTTIIIIIILITITITIIIIIITIITITIIIIIITIITSIATTIIIIIIIKEKRSQRSIKTTESSKTHATGCYLLRSPPNPPKKPTPTSIKTPARRKQGRKTDHWHSEKQTTCCKN